MKIILITNGNAASALALAQFLNRHADSVSAVLITRKLPSSKNNFSGILNMLRRSGPEYTLLKIWVNLLAPIFLRLRKRCASVEDIARKHNKNVKVYSFSDINSKDSIKLVRDIAPDLIISFSATQRFSNEIIDSSRIATVNVHYGALPRYAGLSPYYWHLRNQEEEFGVTLHVIDAGLDSGPIIKQVKRSMSGHRDALSVLHSMANEVSPLLSEFLDSDCRISGAQIQNKSSRSYFGHPTLEDRRAFKADGFSMRSRRSTKKFLAAFPPKS